MSHPRRSARTLWLGALAALILSAGSAFADVIDGNWCHADGRRLSIRGEEIVTPRGNKLTGNYTRHFFDYVTPADEPGAGQTVYLILLSEYAMESRLGTRDAPAQTWRRCSADVS